MCRLSAWEMDPPIPSLPPKHTAQAMGHPSQAHRLAALPDIVEFAGWMLHVQVVAHSVPEAYARTRGVAVEEALRQRQEFRQLLRRCDMMSYALKLRPGCAPDELLSGSKGV